jgi:hypothetical protein
MTGITLGWYPLKSRALKRRPGIRPGDIYEDCGFHPCLCYLAEPVRASRGWRCLLRVQQDLDLSGISLLDGSRPRSCSTRHCAPRKLTLDQALSMRGTWEQGRQAGMRAAADGVTSPA